MLESEDTFLWLNGALCPARSARIDPSDRGLMLGDGLFETIRVAGRVPRRVQQHLARLRHGAEQLGIPLPYGEAEILDAFTQTLEANALDTAVLRLTLTRGVAPRGVAPPADSRPSLLITAAAFVAPPGELSAVICQSTRRNEFSPLAAIKSLNYLDNIIARREAAWRGAEDAILLNTQGNVSEATAANLFLLKNGKWLTPLIADGALPGIFRARALAGYAAWEARISPEDLRAADGICLGNALSIRAISTLDGQAIPSNPAAIAALRAILEAKD